MSVLVAFSVTPLGVGEGVGDIVAEAVRVVRESGLPNKTDSMFTVIEGDSWGQVMAVVERAVEAVGGSRRPGQRGDQGGLAIRRDRRDDEQDRVGGTAPFRTSRHSRLMS